MEEIEVGDYIRTTFGIITKIVKIKDTMLPVGGFVNGIGGTHEHRMQKGKIFRTNHGATVLQEEIKKNSKNIIDLIEVGDYVNGDKITSISQDPFIKGQINLWTDRDEIDCLGDRSTIKYINKDIKSICTKEQFANAEYKLDN